MTPDNTNSTHPSGVVVTLTASASAGWYFADWSGGATGTNNPLKVTMNSNLVITGNFLPYPTYAFTLVTNGQGAINLSPPGGTYLSNTVLTALASPAAGWVFAAWSGATITQANPVSVALDTNVSLTGTFVQLPAFDAQPVSITNQVGSTVIFSAHAVGGAPLNYQWFFSGGLLPPNDTNATLSIPNVSSGQAGNYWVVATNNYGSATSRLASLTLAHSTGPTNVVNSPNEASLRAAVALGGWIGLGFNGTMTIANTIIITNNMVLDGSLVAATISGGNAVRLFYVAPGVTFGATNLTLANGSCTITNSIAGTNADAGAIYNDGGTVTLTACTLTNNSARCLIYGSGARGGAIFNNRGTVVLSQCALSTNSAVGGGPALVNSTFPNNYGLGGAIYNTNGAVVITGCQINGNYCSGLGEGVIGGACPGLTEGGAVYQASGSLAITNSGFTSNQALGGNGAGFPYFVNGSPAYGGAVAVAGGSVEIELSHFFANAAIGGAAGYHAAGGPAFGGAVYSAASLTVGDSLFLGNQTLAGNNTEAPSGGWVGVNGCGGGLYNAGTAVLNRCAVYSNYVQGGSGVAYPGAYISGGNGLGGGIFNASLLASTNCTIALNSASGGDGDVFFGLGPTNGQAIGGGVFNDAAATFVAMNLTLASNSCSSPSSYNAVLGTAAGSQLANTNGAMRLHNCLIAYGGTNGNAFGAITDDGYNICSDGSAGLSSGSSYNNTDPQLAPLADYGGPTLCMALLPTSPAIDNGDSSGSPSTDQRGFVRPAGAGPDMGAFEYGSYLLGVATGVPGYLNFTDRANYYLLSFTLAPSTACRLQTSTNLINWADLNTIGPFASQTNLSQIISKQDVNHGYFRLLMQ